MNHPEPPGRQTGIPGQAAEFGQPLRMVDEADSPPDLDQTLGSQKKILQGGRGLMPGQVPAGPGAGPPLPPPPIGGVGQHQVETVGSQSIGNRKNISLVNLDPVRQAVCRSSCLARRFGPSGSHDAIRENYGGAR